MQIAEKKNMLRVEKFDIDNFEVLIVKADHLRVDVIKLIVKEVIN